MPKFYHFIPKPTTPQRPRDDAKIANAQAPIEKAYGLFLIGFLLTGLLLSIFL